MTVGQLSAQERWDTEFVLSIKGILWSPDGERARDVNIRVDLPVRIRQILTHQSSPAECASLGRRSRGLASPPNVWVAVPFEHELGTQQTTQSAVAKGQRKSSRRSLLELPRSLPTKRESSEPGTRNVIDC